MNSTFDLMNTKKSNYYYYFHFGYTIIHNSPSIGLLHNAQCSMDLDEAISRRVRYHTVSELRRAWICWHSIDHIHILGLCSEGDSHAVTDKHLYYAAAGDARFQGSTITSSPRFSVNVLSNGAFSDREKLSIQINGNCFTVKSKSHHFRFAQNQMSH